MNKNNFKYKSYCELTVISESKPLDYISNDLGIKADRSFRKGDQSVSKHSGSIITKPHHLWAIKTDTTVLETESVSHHISSLQKRLTPAFSILTKFKMDKELNISFLLWLETDNAGIAFNIKADELAFISAISHQMNTTFLSMEALKE